MSTMQNEYFYSLGRLIFLNSHQILFQGLFCPETNKGEISFFFDQNHGLTPLKKIQYGDYVKSIIL